jgi:hypothetical protein
VRVEIGSSEFGEVFVIFYRARSMIFFLIFMNQLDQNLGRFEYDSPFFSGGVVL